jgi:hypothetical protein
MKKFFPLIAILLIVSAITAREQILGLFAKAPEPQTETAPPIEKPRETPGTTPQTIPTHAPTASTPIHSLTCEQRERPNLSCIEEAILHEAKVEILRAIDLFRDLCDKGNGDACYRLGLIYRDRGDSEKMMANYAKGCALVHSTSCFNQEFLLKALGKLRDFREKKVECTPQLLNTCHNIGTLNREVGNLAPAIQNLVPACQGGIGESCLALAEIARASESPAEAKLRYQKACDLKIDIACEALKLL